MLLACLLVLGACQGSEDPMAESSEKVISFCSDMAEQGQGMTRATSLAKDFTVYGYKYISAEETPVFTGWKVRYEGGDNYNYIGIEGQTVRYWDPSATEYRFWASTGSKWIASENESQGDWGKTLTISNRPLRIGKTGTVATDLADDVNLYASLVSRTSPIDPSTVNLKFNHTYSQVSMYFYYEIMQMGVAELQIKNVQFTPVATAGKADKIYNNGQVIVTYPATGTETVTVNGDNSDYRTHFDFAVNTALKGETGLGASHAVQAEIADQNKFYYPLPMGDQNPEFELTMDITELDANGNEVQTTRRTAVIPAIYMCWKPNYAYRYFFKITESSLSLQYDVQIEPWIYGGSQDEVWNNWWK